jgi:diguanylate cyclase (GGDEF)-like protein
MAMVAAVTLALMAPGATAHGAVTVTVPLPQTGAQIPPTQVTTPGASVTIGPGGASVTVDAKQAVGGVTGNVPPARPVTPTPPAGQDTAGNTAPQPSAAGSTPSAGESTRSQPASSKPKSRPSARKDRAVSVRRSSATSARGTSPTSPASAAGLAPAPAARRDTGSPAKRAPEQRPRQNAVRQVIERIPEELLAALLVLALFAAAMSLIWLRERGQVRAARRLAQVDPLTGISNRLAFEQRLTGEWKRARRYDRPLGVLLLDIDGLKDVNDRDGHAAGDRLITAAATQLAEHTRESDMAARLAGDEFVVLCPETPREGLELLGAKLYRQLDEVGIAASIGWAELTESDMRPSDLLARADAAMYQEKARRRREDGVAKARPDLAIAG